MRSLVRVQDGPYFLKQENPSTTSGAVEQANKSSAFYLLGVIELQMAMATSTAPITIPNQLLTENLLLIDSALPVLRLISLTYGKNRDHGHERKQTDKLERV